MMTLEVKDMITMKDIITDQDPRIREISKEVELPLSDEDRNKLMEMMEYLKNSQNEELSEKYHLRPGVGLAAIQLGIPKRMLTIYIPDYDEEGNMTHKEEWALVNPKLVAYTQKEAYIKAGEGCLSVPEDLQGYVPRHAKVVVEAYDAITDKQVKITARGFFSMCLQHEMDHLDGILYYDHFNKDNPLAPIPNAMVIE